MIEHRLYSIEIFVDHARVKTAGHVVEKFVLCTPSLATWYALKGYTIFDFTESLGMDPEYFEKEILHEY